jgi:hypothetical protein
MRRIALVLAVLLVLVAAAYTAFWFVVAGRAEGWIADWARPEPGKDWEGEFQAVEVSGFPFSLDVMVTAPRIVWHGGDREATWTGPWLLAHYRPWNYERIDFELPEQQNVVVTEPGRSHAIDLASAEAFGFVKMADGRARRVVTEFVDLVATVDDNPTPVTADRLTVEAEGTAQRDNHDLKIEVRNLSFEASVPPPFGGNVPFAAASLSLKGAVPSGGPLRERLALWRDAGGTLDVASLEVDWPPLALDADGTVALDEAFRPEAAFSSAITGYGGLLDALVDLGTVSRNEASVAKTMLDVMAKRDEATGERRIEVPVSIQNGTLFVGPIPLMPVPPVVTP